MNKTNHIFKKVTELKEMKMLLDAFCLETPISVIVLGALNFLTKADILQVNFRFYRFCDYKMFICFPPPPQNMSNY